MVQIKMDHYQFEHHPLMEKGACKYNPLKVNSHINNNKECIGISDWSNTEHLKFLVLSGPVSAFINNTVMI